MSKKMVVITGSHRNNGNSFALLKWKMVGEVMIPSVLNADDIEKTDGCKQAADLADKF